MENNEIDYSLRFLLLGYTGVGKTSLFYRFMCDKFKENCMSTIGLDVRTKVLNIEDKIIKIMIYDIGFQDHYQFPPKHYYKSSHGCAIIYDINNRISFEYVKKCIDSIELNQQNDIRKILIGNKNDLDSERERKVTMEEGKKLADEYNMNFIETSAKNDYNIKEAFELLVKDIIKNNKNLKNNKLQLKKNDKKNRREKCIK